MTRQITKTTISEEEDSPYQGYPQMGDTIYIMNDRDNRLGAISDWCKKNIHHGYYIFTHSANKKGLWFADNRAGRRFEEEWM